MLIRTFTADFDFYCHWAGWTHITPANRGVSAGENPRIQLKGLKGSGVHGNTPRVNPCDTNAVTRVQPHW